MDKNDLRACLEHFRKVSEENKLTMVNAGLFSEVLLAFLERVEQLEKNIGGV